MYAPETVIMFDLIVRYYEWIRAFHIIAVIFWMAGLLYLPRLYIYHHQSMPGGELEATLILQERRLLKIIMNPSMILAFIFGILLIWIRWEVFSAQNWLELKLVAVAILMGFHGMLAADRKKLAAGQRPKSEKAYRLMNEMPALLTILIVIMAVIEPF